jgi:hypothetical protein
VQLVDVDLMDDPGFVAHQAAERHMAKVWAAFYAEEDGEEGEELLESPAFGPFDGCDTCIIREILAAVWPVIEEYHRRLRAEADRPAAPGQPGPATAG